MKKYLLIAFLILYNLSNAQDFKNPNDYLTYLGKETDRLTQSLWQYTSAIAHSRNISLLNERRMKLLEDSKLVNQKVNDLKDGYKGDVVYRNQLLEYLFVMDKQINSEYEKINELENGVNKSYEEIEKYTLNRNEENIKIKNLVEELNQYQKVFADKYGIRITENKSDVTNKMKISNDVFNYHSRFYLIFLKINIEESKFIDAIGKYDLDKTNESLKNLKILVNQNLVKLKTLDSYNNDATLYDKTLNFLEFINKEINEFGSSAVSYFKIKQNFEAIKAKNLAKTDKTPEEVNEYNNAVQEKNFNFKSYMRINDYFNSEREQIIKDWNQEGDRFIDKHIPVN